MSLFSLLAWRLKSNEKKLEQLKSRGLTIGTGCEILNGFDFGSEPYLVTIGDNVRLASGVKITTHDGGAWVLRHLYPELSDIDRFGRVAIGDNCHIGMDAMIMPGVTIGKNCIVGARSVVTHDVPDNTVVAGVPARSTGPSMLIVRSMRASSSIRNIWALRINGASASGLIPHGISFLNGEVASLSSACFNVL